MKSRSNINKALAQLEKAVKLAEMRALSDLEEQGLIHVFEFTHELAWNVLKDYFTYQGNTEIRDTRDAFRAAFSAGLIENGEAWMGTIRSRNKTSHTYNEVVAGEIATAVVEVYFGLFKRLAAKMLDLENNLEDNLFS